MSWILEKWWNLYFGCRNVAAFGSAVWSFNTCDYSHMLELIEIGARLMRDLHLDQPITTDAPKLVRQLTIVTTLCQRLRDDNYFENAGYSPTTWLQISELKRTLIVEHATAMATNDAAYLGRMFRFVRHWWS